MDAIMCKILIGSLTYLLHKQPELTYSESVLGRYMVKPTIHHWTVANRVLRHLKGTIYFGLIYEKGVKTPKIISYIDSNFSGVVVNRKSTAGQVFFLVIYLSHGTS